MNAETFRKAMRQFASGVFVITTRLDGRLHATTATAFLPLSAEPPLVLVCMHNDSQTHRALSERPNFGINMLAQHQSALSTRFAGKSLDRYRLDDVPHFHGPNGSIFFTGAAAHFEVETQSTTAGGDHTIFISRVTWASADHGVTPLLYHQAGHHALAPLDDETVAPPSRRDQLAGHR